jgi:hypothetical protein
MMRLCSRGDILPSPLPASLDAIEDLCSCFVLKDAAGQKLAYVYFGRG